MFDFAKIPELLSKFETLINMVRMLSMGIEELRADNAQFKADNEKLLAALDTQNKES